MTDDDVLPLTNRQLQVARLISDGLTDKQIAHALDLSEGTVAAHVHRIMLRLELDGQRNIRVQIAKRVIQRPAA